MQHQLSPTLKVALPFQQITRLRYTCFRGSDQHKAGNFFAWSSFYDFITDPETRSLLCTAIENATSRNTHTRIEGHKRFELTYSRFVGFDSVMAGEDLTLEDRVSANLVRFKRRGAMAYFLPRGRILAPQANVVTVAGNLHRVRGGWNFVIQSMYPGEDCGDMCGNMTERFGWYWLSWENPGDPQGLE